jgi:hypothetical protein
MRQGGSLRDGGHRDQQPERNAERHARDERDHDPLVLDDLELEQRGDDRDEHADLAGPDAAPGGRRMRQPLQGQHEAPGREQVREREEGVVHDVAHAAAPFEAGSSVVWSFSRGGASRRLNIFSMRSVMRKPETMLVVEAKTATAPRIVA